MLQEADFALSQNSGELSIDEEDEKIQFQSGDISGEFNKKRGSFSYYKKGDTRIGRLPEPYFWRAPTDNDFGNHMPSNLGVWRTAHVNKSLEEVVVGEQSKEGLPITVKYMLKDIGVPYTLAYLIRNDGSIQVTSSIDMSGKTLPELPRFGMRMTLPGQFDQVSYYGRGPEENYSDRKTASFLGIWEHKASEQKMPYIRPQEYGNHTDTRWVKLFNESEESLVITGLQPFDFSALNIRAEDMDPGLTKKQQHPTDLSYSNDITLHIDLLQRGLGGDTSWGAYPHRPYRLHDEKYSYSFVITIESDKK
ncbi:beta-galactosidase small subunit [Reichenbachiella ulvae]|uniref:beta-galactosidase n=1 Tax=Reichenbachiella ulvae TaxID=2980104 RepID=A0ABT3CVV8_9BACT|nr:beta-galactosidase small subunit [Reichenbachiella ulvae]MCV9387373.1 beta-galactosidase small subunit [Reichenbachiella ulvae]